MLQILCFSQPSHHCSTVLETSNIKEKFNLASISRNSIHGPLTPRLKNYTSSVWRTKGTQLMAARKWAEKFNQKGRSEEADRDPKFLLTWSTQTHQEVCSTIHRVDPRADLLDTPPWWPIFYILQKSHWLRRFKQVKSKPGFGV